MQKRSHYRLPEGIQIVSMRKNRADNDLSVRFFVTKIFQEEKL